MKKKNIFMHNKDDNSFYVSELQTPIFINGQLVYENKTLEEIRKKVKKELASIPEAVKKLNDPQPYDVHLSPALLKLKRDLIVSRKCELSEKKLVKVC